MEAVPCGDCVDGINSAGNSCAICGGDGLISLLGPEFVNIRYTAEKRLLGIFYSMMLENTTMPTNVFRSYQVLECLDETEYSALSDADKASLQFLLQCSLVDLNDGKAGKVRLWAWFDAESTTRANLITLLG